MITKEHQLLKDLIEPMNIPIAREKIFLWQILNGSEGIFI